LPANRRKRRFTSSPETADEGEPAVSPNNS
jgi:hypothetical protein